MSRPGVRLRNLASRVFHPDTMEYVVGPALADLHLECTARQSSAWRRSWVFLRAYLSFWAAVIMHLGQSLIEGSADTTPDDHGALRRVLLYAAAITVIVTAVLVAPGWVNRPVSAAGPQTAFVVRALLLLIPQATPISIPAGMLFGTLWVVRKPATRSIRRTVLVLGIVCSLFSAGMLAWVIPEANQAYRVVVYQEMRGESHPPSRGANELTWHDLRERVIEANTRGASPETRMFRLSYHTRIALVATPLVFAMLALALVRRPRRFMSWLLGLLLFVAYYTVLLFDRLVAQGTVSPLIAAWTPNVVALTLFVMISASSAFSAVET